jgi:hypothetical protein
MSLTQVLSSFTDPIARVPSEHSTQASAVRLSLEPIRGRMRAVDGAWWPRSTDATAELPGLIAAVDRRTGEMTLRVGLHVDAWDNIPHRIPAPGRAVRVGWFRSMDRRLVSLTMRGRDAIILRVIPPEARTESARAIFASATGLDVNAVSPAASQAAEQDVWDNEGGRFGAG